MKLQERLSILCRLGVYLKENGALLQQAKHRAYAQNRWFVPQFIDLAIENIVHQFLDREKLETWASQYNVPDKNDNPVLVGVTMAGNIPLVGFHDWLTIFLAGQRQAIKPSSKDEILIKHIIETLVSWEPAIADLMHFSERLTGCDAYIATGSNNSGRYFEYYFGKYPHIIRRNRTSAAILSGHETPQELENLADDILQYFGLGCRNVSKLYVPANFNFEPLVHSMGKYIWMKDHDKFRNNYDYQLSLLILNNKYYMSNEMLLLVESKELFSPIAQVNYEFYDETPENITSQNKENLQCLCGTSGFSLGSAQIPSLMDYADGVDTMTFALSLNK